MNSARSCDWERPPFCFVRKVDYYVMFPYFPLFFLFPMRFFRFESFFFVNVDLLCDLFFDVGSDEAMFPLI